MYSPAALSLFGQVKACFDPDNRLNPGVVVDPARVDADLRTTALIGRFDHFAEAVHRCTGVGQVPGRHDGRAGRDVPVVPGHPGGEGLHPRPGAGTAGDDQRRHHPQGLGLGGGALRARPVPVLQGLRADCPTGIDMAAYKAEVLTRRMRAGCGRAATTRWAGCRAGPG